jgi:hypothetical protein
VSLGGVEAKTIGLWLICEWEFGKFKGKLRSFDCCELEGEAMERQAPGGSGCF